MEMEHEANENYLDAEADTSLVERVEEENADDKEPLTMEQVMIGDAQIAAYHPLRSQPIEAIFPMLCCCFKCCRSDDEESEAVANKKEQLEGEIENRK